MRTCENCGSARLIYLRHDLDWGGGNSARRVNADEYYNPGDCNPDEGDDMDIEVTVCLLCGVNS